MRRVRFHHTTFFNDTLECLEPCMSLNPPYVTYDHCVYPVGSSIFQYSKVLLSHLPSEIVLNILLLLEPKDVRNISMTCNWLNSFVHTYFQSVPREKIQKIVIQSSPEEIELPRILRRLSMMESVNTLVIETRKYHLDKAQRRDYYLSIHRSVNNKAHLWRTQKYKEEKLLNIFSNIDFPMHCQLVKDANIELYDIIFTDAVLLTLKKTICAMVKQGYPDSRSKQSFRLRLFGCTFSNTTKGSFKLFTNSMLDTGMSEFYLNNVQFRDVKFLCFELSKSNINQLTTFRFHSTEIRTDRADSITKLFEPFYKNTRLTKKVVIDGFEMPLHLCSKVMINFCCTPFFTKVPPSLRVVIGIAREVSRDDLFDVLTKVLLDINSARSSIRHRLNHVFLELGLYNNERFTSMLNHCVLDVNLLRSRKKLNELEASVNIF